MKDEVRKQILRAAAEDAGAAVVALEMGQRLAIRLGDGSPRGVRIPVGSEVVDSIICHPMGTPARARAEKALTHYLKKKLEENTKKKLEEAARNPAPRREEEPASIPADADRAARPEGAPIGKTGLLARKTLDYFDSHTPEYGEERLAPAAGIIRRLARPESSLVEIGCGTGNVLQYLKQETGLRSLCGVDVSSNCLDALSRRVDCERRQGSILDPGFVASLEERFDFAVMAAVLHRLVGRTRRESKGYARQAVENALRTLKPDGRLIVSEPVFRPALAMDLIFYVKKIVTSVSSSRVQVLGHWNNIGAPVVSYLTPDELVAAARASRAGRVAEVHAEEQPLHWLARLALIQSRQEVTLLIQKDEMKAASGIPPPPVANPSGDPSRRG